MLRLLVCVSGGGTNLQAIFDAIDAGKIRNAEIAAVISNNPGAYALERARQHNVEAICLSPKSFESREAFNHALTEKVKEIAPDLIVLAGFLVAVPAEMIEAFPNQIINIHPSLIPAFCGVGFYGLHVHEGVLARGAKVTGATVHFVDSGMDTGPIILQKAVEVQQGDTPKSLQQRVMEEAEWKILPQAIDLIAQGRVTVVDGKTIKIMTSAQDHKRAKDGDQGLNTGGMGTFSPSPFYTDEVDAFCRKYVYQPTVDAMKAEGREFKGIIFFGLMLTENGPKVLEYNARFGDPETQVVLPRMKNDIVDVFEACVDGTLDQIELEFEDNAAVCVVLASDGYPEHYDKGYKIDGLDRFDGQDGYYVFHAGSKFDKDGNVVTNGGRVLGVTAKGNTLKEARENAYKATEWVEFGNKYMRHDIGKAIDEVGVVM